MNTRGRVTHICTSSAIVWSSCVCTHVCVHACVHACAYGTPKGLIQVLNERGIDTRRMKLDDMREEFASHSDF